MKKTFKVQFQEEGKPAYIFEFITEDINKAISEYSRNRQVNSYTLLEEQVQPVKSLLLG